MVLISSRSAVFATVVSLAALSVASPVGTIPTRDSSPSKASHKSTRPLMPAGYQSEGSSHKKGYRRKGGNSKSQEHKERSRMLDTANPISQMVNGAQAFFESKDSKLHIRRASIVVPGEKKGSYAVSRRQSSANSGDGSSDPAGKIDVMTPDQKRVGSLYFDPVKNTMLVSDSNSTVFFVHQTLTSAEGQLCQLKANLVQNTTEVHPCTTFGEDGDMFMSECRPDGDHQTFLYNEADSSVRPTIENSNSTTASSVDDVDDTDSQDTVSSFSIGARDGGASVTNVTLVFVPSDPVMAKDMSSSAITTSTVTTTFTSTMIVTATDVAAAAEVSPYDSSSVYNSTFAAVPTTSASDAMNPVMTGASTTGANSTPTTDASAADATAPSGDAQGVASSIANTPPSSMSSSATASTSGVTSSSASSATSTMPVRSIRFRSTAPYNLRFDSSKA